MTDRAPGRSLGSVWVQVRVSRPAAPLPGRVRAKEAPEILKGRRSPVVLGLLVLVGCAVGLLVLWGLGEGRRVADEQDPQRETVSAANQSSEQPSPTLTATSAPTSSTPVALGTPEAVAFENPTVNISLYEGTNLPHGYGSVVVEIMASGSPLQGVQIAFAPAIQNITGEWAKGDIKDWPPELRKGCCPIYVTDLNGVAGEVFPQGDYILLDATSYGSFPRLQGSWGIVGRDGNNPVQMVPFTIRAGKITKIALSLAQLDIGVLSADGHAVVRNVVWVYCQGADIAGDPISAEGCRQDSLKTAATGIATFYLGVGTYMVRVLDLGVRDDPWLYGILLGPGEHRADIATLSY